MRIAFKGTQWVAILSILMVCSLNAKTANSFTPNIMGPLWLETESQWQIFTADLKAAKAIGVRAVTIDVWWGTVEHAGDQQFDWSYYDRIFETILEHELRIIPIMSFHQCGGNVNDDCNVPLPRWIWNQYTNLPSNALKYKSEQGNFSNEYLSLWANEYAVPQYIEFMQAFEKQYADIADHIDELNISMGPAGELRMPSYNQHDSGTHYPTRGGWQVYGSLAVADFRNYLHQKYGNIGQLNRHWQTKFRSFDDIEPAKPELCAEQHCLETIDWFHSALINHGETLLKAGNQAFSSAFRTIPLGYKIPGIHWLMAKTGKWHRAAEIATGLLPATIEQGSGYANVIKLAKTPLDGRQIILHFTTLEMADSPDEPAYSLANTLVQSFTQEAEAMRVNVKGENSLAAGITNSFGWMNIDQHFAQGRFTGITVLRLNTLVNSKGKEFYQSFIEKYSSALVQ